MPKTKQARRTRVHPRQFTGVYKEVSPTRQYQGKPDEIYTIVYTVDGKTTWESLGWKSEGMTPGIAQEIRGERMRKARHGGEVKTNKELRAERRKRNQLVQAIADAYFEQRETDCSMDKYRWNKHIAPVVGHKQVRTLTELDIQQIRKNLTEATVPRSGRKGYSDASKRCTLELLGRVIRFGARRGMCPPLGFEIDLPKLDNEKTEYLTNEQAQKLMAVLDSWPTQNVPRMIKLAMFTGMRRGEIFKLQVADLDFDHDLILLRQPKGGKSTTIPMNTLARQIIEAQLAWKAQRMPHSPFVFPGRDGAQRVECRAVYRIKRDAGLPKDFRMFHGLRHHFAVTLANSGQVTLDMIQDLLTHKSQAMTRRYAKFLPETLKSASNVAVDLFQKQLEKDGQDDGQGAEPESQPKLKLKAVK